MNGFGVGVIVSQEIDGKLLRVASGMLVIPPVVVALNCAVIVCVEGHCQEAVYSKKMMHPCTYILLYQADFLTHVIVFVDTSGIMYVST